AQVDDSHIDAHLHVATSALDEAKALARSGDLERARAAFRQMVHNDPENEDAWLWLAYVAASKEDSLRYLQEAQAFLPGSERIAEGLRWAEARIGQSGARIEEAQAPARPSQRSARNRNRRALGRASAPGEVTGRARETVLGVMRTALRAAFSPSYTSQGSPAPERDVANNKDMTEDQGPAEESTALAEDHLSADEKEGPSVAPSASPSPRSRSRRRHRAARPTPSLDLGPIDKPAGESRALRLPRLDGERLRATATAAGSMLAIVAIVAFALLGIVHARSLPRTARAEELPTRIPNPTSTPTIEQRIQPFWIQVDVAWTRQDWDAAIEALNRIRDIDPENEEARKRLGEAHYYHGLRLIDENKLEEARLELDMAIRLNASSKELQQIRRDLKLYLLGLEAYWAKDWPRVVECLQKVYNRRPDFRDTREMLGQAYYQVGIERQANEVWDEARDAYQAALDLLPDLEDAEKRLAEVMDIIIPPNRIEVDLSDKLTTVYENHQPIKVFPVCTGRPSAPTLPGRYLIQSKLPEAYASKWDLRMPWWLGIYWAGGSENGFHALPILSNGRILWRSALGTGCSYGCIVLDTEDAIWLYKWAEIGTVVLINP
ncbi:MAG: L,D-transpeptidase family protein, partial [Chloroflexi bacterium]|nr:L,D-transpeptidase family protein [Chloroflexota bacterium]